ncbi:MAG: pyrroline-5-carboxylate reductase [Acidobacteriota bacterium]|nr:pyrroline-5-carboxylate reductase [Acidobacteriota bacterium]
MGGALVRGLLAAGWAPDALAVAETDAGRRRALEALVPGVAVGAAPVAADGAVVAVKPQVAEPACRALANAAVPRWLSIMAGVPLARLEAWAGPAVAVVRAMPNTPALVGAGITAVAPGTRAGEAELAWAAEVLGAVGEVVRVTEEDLDAVTAVSGSGPAYVFLLAEAMAEAGEAAGLEPELARRLARSTVAGAGRLLAGPEADPRALRAQVTSPGGTTEAAVGAFEEGGLRALVATAVQAAAARSRALANEGP